MADGGPSRKSAARVPGAKLDVAVVRHDEAWRGAGGLQCGEACFVWDL
jgi:hypothetical protein